MQSKIRTVQVDYESIEATFPIVIIGASLFASLPFLYGASAVSLLFGF